LAAGAGAGISAANEAGGIDVPEPENKPNPIMEHFKLSYIKDKIGHNIGKIAIAITAIIATGFGIKYLVTHNKKKKKNG
jgi:hypothetical protein